MPAVGDIEYTFKHALTQEVASNSVLNERRRHLHERTGAAIELLYADRLEDHVNELAHHYGRSTNIEKAVEYLSMAANMGHVHPERIEQRGETIASVQSNFALIDEYQYIRLA